MKQITTTPPLNLPGQQFEINEDFIFDRIRKKWVKLTPEEWVRQNFLAYLINIKKYPRSLIKIEETIKAFNKIKRCDAVIYNHEIEPLAILECKAPGISLSNTVFRQIAIYNSAIKAPYLFVSNGMDHYCCKISFNDNKYSFLDQIPFYDELSR